jgi:hypothetical protein
VLPAVVVVFDGRSCWPDWPPVPAVPAVLPLWDGPVLAVLLALLSEPQPAARRTSSALLVA